MTEQYTQIIEFTKTVVTKDNLKRIDDIIDNLISPIKDYTDTIEDMATPVKGFLSLLTLRRKLALKAFIKNYSRCLGEEFIIDKSKEIKLRQYFSKIENFQIISETIDNALYAKSIKASATLGVIAGEILRTSKTITEADIISVSSLREMTDIDIDNFTELIANREKLIPEEFKGIHKVEELELRTREIYAEKSLWKPKTISKISMEMTIEKLKRTDALSYSEGGIGSVGNARGAFMITENTIYLYTLIRKTINNYCQQ